MGDRKSVPAVFLLLFFTGFHGPMQGCNFGVLQSQKGSIYLPTSVIILSVYIMFSSVYPLYREFKSLTALRYRSWCANIRNWHKKQEAVSIFIQKDHRGYGHKSVGQKEGTGKGKETLTLW